MNEEQKKVIERVTKTHDFLMECTQDHERLSAVQATAEANSRAALQRKLAAGSKYNDARSVFGEVFPESRP